MEGVECRVVVLLISVCPQWAEGLTRADKAEWVGACDRPLCVREWSNVPRWVRDFTGGENCSAALMGC